MSAASVIHWQGNPAWEGQRRMPRTSACSPRSGGKLGSWEVSRLSLRPQHRNTRDACRGMPHWLAFQDHSAPVLETSHLWRLLRANWARKHLGPSTAPLSLGKERGPLSCSTIWEMGQKRSKENNLFFPADLWCPCARPRLTCSPPQLLDPTELRGCTE